MTVILDAMLGLYKCCHIKDYVDMTNSEGLPTGPAYGFLKGLAPLLEQLNATKCVAVFDGGRSRRRMAVFDGYKANRKKDEDLARLLTSQRALLERLLPRTGVPVVEVPGKEGDDVVALLAREEDEAIIVSEDGDLLQCVSSTVSVFRPLKEHTGVGLVTVDNFQEAVGVPLHQFILYKSVVGDSSDGIGGVPGVGPKTIKPLLEQMKTGTPEELREVAKRAGGAKARKIDEEYDSLLRGIELTDLRREQFSAEDRAAIADSLYSPEVGYDYEFLIKQFLDLGYRSIVNNFVFWNIPFRRLGKWQQKEVVGSAEQKSVLI